MQVYAGPTIPPPVSWKQFHPVLSVHRLDFKSSMENGNLGGLGTESPRS